MVWRPGNISAKAGLMGRLLGHAYGALSQRMVGHNGQSTATAQGTAGARRAFAAFQKGHLS